VMLKAPRLKSRLERGRGRERGESPHFYVMTFTLEIAGKQSALLLGATVGETGQKDQHSHVAPSSRIAGP